MMPDSEREVELEMDDFETDESQSESELFREESELFREAQVDLERDESQSEVFREAGDDFETDESQSEVFMEAVEDPEVNKQSDRLYELVAAGFESESDVDERVNEIVHEMEVRYLFDGLKKRWNKLKKSKFGGFILNKVKKGLPGFKALQAATNFIRKPTFANLTNVVKNAAITGATNFIPGGAAVVDVATNLGVIPGGGAEVNREALENVVRTVKDTYEILSKAPVDLMLDPAEALKLSSTAFTTAYNKNSVGSDISSKSSDVARVRVRKGVKKVILYLE